MGTDWIRLYNKSLSDQILAMTQPSLIRFLEENIYILVEKEKRDVLTFTPLVDVMEEDKISVAKAVKKLVAESNLREFKIDIALSYCYGEEQIYLDYWGCFVHVFREGIPKGSIPSTKYLGRTELEFVLLTPKQVDRIIKSLKEHSSDLPVMKRMKTGIDRVEYFRDFCRGHPEYWVAYTTDY